MLTNVMVGDEMFLHLYNNALSMFEHLVTLNAISCGSIWLSI